MLARAAIRSLRIQSTPNLLRTTFPYTRSRSYAKPSKAPRPTDDTSPTLSPPSTKPNLRSASSSGLGPATAGAAATSSERKSTSSAKSEIRERDLFTSESRPSPNTAPISPRPGPDQGSAPLSGSSASSHLEYSKLQDEFETSPASKANTTPQSTSPSATDPAQAAQQETTQPLPDLTKGIPSTLDAELANASAGSKPPSLNVTEDPEEITPGGGRRGELPKTAYISSTDRKRDRLANYMYAFLLGSTITGCIYLGRNWENEEEERKHPDAPSGWGFRLFYNRANARLTSTMDYFTEPTFPKLLPDPDPAWARPYTLVISMEDLLVHSEWSREHGWRTAKRPGVDYFLRYLSQYYELVVFTSLPFMTGDPIFRKLDPYRIIMWPLYREATRYKGGEYIKVCLLSHIVVVCLHFARICRI